jgi:hypothetical protein
MASTEIEPTDSRSAPAAVSRAIERELGIRREQVEAIIEEWMVDRVPRKAIRAADIRS